MNTSLRLAARKPPFQEEINGLERALDGAYARLRDRARAAWEAHQIGRKEPFDACVSVRVTTGSSEATIRRPARQLLPAWATA